MIKIIEITDRKSKILFDNEKYSGDRKVKLMVEKPEKEIIFKVTFEEAKKIIFENRNEISFIQIESENFFNKEEFVLLTFFENFAYFIKDTENFINDLEIYSQKDRYFSFKTGRFNIFVKNGTLYSNADLPENRKELLEYKTILPFVFNKSGFIVENENEYLSFKNDKAQHFYKENEKIVFENNKISVINLEKIEKIKENFDKKEFSKEKFEIMFEINQKYVNFSKNEGKIFFNSYDYDFYTIYELEKKELLHYYNELNEIEIFQKSIEKAKKIIKNYSNDNFNEIFEILQEKIEEKIQQIKEEKRKEEFAEQNFKNEFEKRMTEINI